jgi:hypothetical protein
MFICKVCGKVFYRNKYQIQHSKGEFCSYKCYWETMKGKLNHNLNWSDHPKQSRECLFCHKQFLPNNSKTKYCNSICYHNSTIKPKIKNIRRSDWNSWKKNVPLSKSNAKKISIAIKKHYDKIGRKDIRNKHSTPEYKEWTKKVLVKDN